MKGDGTKNRVWGTKILKRADRLGQRVHALKRGEGRGWNPLTNYELLPQIKCLITLRIQSSIISIDSNITYNIIRRTINV